MPKSKTAAAPEVPAKNINPRASGLLCHPTSFPSRYGIGDMGRSAYDFVDFLSRAQQTLWQVLPLGPTGYGDSPYQSFSSFAGNHYIICPDLLHEQGYLDAADLQPPPFDRANVDFGPVIEYKTALLRRAFEGFRKNSTAAQKKQFAFFASQNDDWLPDYALFYALKTHFGGKPWHMWSDELVRRAPDAMSRMRKQLEDEIDFHFFLQYEFFRQWSNLRAYANSLGISIIGDLPIFTALDSADVWSAADQFLIDAAGNPSAVAGVPPDYFSKTGQLWGNPLYDWDAHKKNGYKWWASRLGAVYKMVDIVRIDHFRGFESYWAVPAKEKTAISGSWQKGPGAALFDALRSSLGDVKIIAEDLGEITKEVDDLRIGLGLPGMKVLQFAFDPDAKSTHMPHNFCDANTVVYTGTHDNNTTVGWYSEAPEEVRDYLRRYLNISGNDIAWDLIRLAWSTCATKAIAPVQDVLELGAAARMNSPGLADGWWRFRYEQHMLTDGICERLKYYGVLFNRN